MTCQNEMILPEIQWRHVQRCSQGSATFNIFICYQHVFPCCGQIYWPQCWEDAITYSDVKRTRWRESTLWPAFWGSNDWGSCDWHPRELTWANGTRLIRALVSPSSGRWNRVWDDKGLYVETVQSYPGCSLPGSGLSPSRYTYMLS